MRAGWIVLEWTGRVWKPYYDTSARTRRAAIRLWCHPSGYEPVATLAEYRKRQRAHELKVVQLFAAYTPDRGGPR